MSGPSSLRGLNIKILSPLRDTSQRNGRRGTFFIRKRLFISNTRIIHVGTVSDLCVSIRSGSIQTIPGVSDHSFPSFSCLLMLGLTVRDDTL